jgi:transglutaminase-like putative cysteine protease
VSRREFRAELVAPRPAAAFVMGVAASATLAVTGQVAPLALGVALLSIALGAWLRESPHPTQRNPWLLNLALGGIAALAVTLWFQGALAIVAFAHFAVLTQALQLLDARPRRSEFLLVALALFQVVLAANLTDSLLFPPLLVVFSMAAVWTLMVHTLRAEAIEAGEAAAVRGVVTRQLLGMTCAASLLTVVLALAIFPLLPRVRAGAFLAGGFGGSLGVSGFSDRVELGDLGRIRLDPQVALRVDTLEGEEPGPEDAYWRGLAFDHFDGRRWSVTPPERSAIPGTAELGILLASERRGPRLEQRIVREPVTSGVLFSAGRALRLQGSFGRVERDANGAFYAFASAPERIAYTLTSAPELVPEATLRRDRALPPRGAGERFAQLPELSPSVAELAASIVAGLETDAERARALERHLRKVGRYTDTPPAHGQDGASPIESFLLERTEGHCEYFASSMVVLARAVGLPARLVNGFAGGERNAIAGFVEVRQADAHTWVEVHYEKAGWVRYDPTPPDLRLAGASALSARDRLAALQSALEFWWFRNVIDYDRGRQMAALRGVWLAWHAWRGQREQPAEAAPGPGRDGTGVPLCALGYAALGLGAVAALALASRAARGRRHSPIPAYYRTALRLVARHGPRRGAAATARQHAAAVARTLEPAAAGAFARVTELYLAERFGGRAAAGEAAAALGELRDILRP